MYELINQSISVEFKLLQHLTFWEDMITVKIV